MAVSIFSRSYWRQAECANSPEGHIWNDGRCRRCGLSVHA